MNIKIRSLLLLVVTGILVCSVSVEAKVVVALNPLSSVSGLEGEQTAVSDVMQAELSQSENITLVDREQMHRVLNELKLGQQGMLSPESARALGQIVGARYFCSGSVREAGDKAMATVKVIDIETTLTKLAYAFLKSKDDAVEAGQTLAGQVEKVIAQFEEERTQREKEAAAEAAKKTAKVIPSNWKRPTVMVIIREMHIRQPQLIDPAAETEITKRLIADNFTVIDSEYVTMMKRGQQIDAAKPKLRFNFKNLKTCTQYAAKKNAEVLLYGEAVSERAAGLGDFEGCPAGAWN